MDGITDERVDKQADRRMEGQSDNLMPRRTFQTFKNIRTDDRPSGDMATVQQQEPIQICLFVIVSVIDILYSVSLCPSNLHFKVQYLKFM